MTTSDDGRPAGQRIMAAALNAVSAVLLGFIAISLLGGTDSRPAAPNHTVEVGDKLNVQGVNWQSHARTLVIAISPECAACERNATFYRRLLQYQGASFQSVLALPGALGRNAGTFASRFGYKAAHVATIDLAANDIHTTPTVFLVSQDGRIAQQWIGSLSDAEQDDVASHLDITGWTPATPSRSLDLVERRPLVLTVELLQLVRTGAAINIIDVRGRDDYAKGSINTAVNIPSDEMEVRVLHEVAPGRPTLIYCGYSAACDADGRPSLCSSAVSSLASAGVSARVIRDPIRLLRDAGIDIVENQKSRY